MAALEVEARVRGQLRALRLHLEEGEQHKEAVEGSVSLLRLANHQRSVRLRIKRHPQPRLRLVSPALLGQHNQPAAPLEEEEEEQQQRRRNQEPLAHPQHQRPLHLHLALLEALAAARLEEEALLHQQAEALARSQHQRLRMTRTLLSRRRKRTCRRPSSTSSSSQSSSGAQYPAWSRR